MCDAKEHFPQLDSILNAVKILLVLSGVSRGVSLCSYTNFIDTTVGIPIACMSLVFLISNGIVKSFLSTMGRKKKTNLEITLHCIFL